MTKSYKEEFSLDQRSSESNRILAKYPDRVPIIIECKNKELNGLIHKKKFLVPSEISVSYLIVGWFPSSNSHHYTQVLESRHFGVDAEVTAFLATNLRRGSSRPFVVSPELVEGSNHERLNRSSFDCSTGSQLRTNG